MVRMVATDVAVVASGVATYFGVRGLTAGDADAAVDHAHDVLAVEEALGLDVEADVQALLVDVEPLTTAANWVYIWGHWPVIAAVRLWLAVRNRTVFLRLRNAMIASGLMGLCVYTTYPVAPPRLAGMGFVDTITEQSSSYRVLQPPAFVNQYAAMPSLHVGWDLLVGLAILSAASATWLRMVGRLMPVLMVLATIATANHYLLDAIAGVAFALAGLWVALVVETHRRPADAAGHRAADPDPPRVIELPDVPAPRTEPLLPSQRVTTCAQHDDPQVR